MAVTMHLKWTLGDRLAKARRQSGISVEAMAERLGVGVKTVYNIERDRYPVKRAYVVTYSWATGVPVAELDPPDPDGVQCPPWDSNPEPADYLAEPVFLLEHVAHRARNLSRCA